MPPVKSRTIVRLISIPIQRRLPVLLFSRTKHFSANKLINTKHPATLSFKWRNEITKMTLKKILYCNFFFTEVFSFNPNKKKVIFDRRSFILSPTIFLCTINDGALHNTLRKCSIYNIL